MKRRSFLKLSAISLCGLSVSPWKTYAAETLNDLPFQISLAEWSLNRTIRSGKMTNLDFPRVAKQEFGIDCIEFVDQFFADKSKDMGYLSDLKKRAEGEGVAMNLIMIDTTGDFGAGSKADRDKAIEKTFPWIDAAKFLGCKTVRINARGPGSKEELKGRIAESCVRLSEYAAERNINIAIENHGGPSSDPEWLVAVMKEVNKPNFGTLPDFGNFDDQVNRYDAVEMMMPYAKAVSAKSQRFSGDLVTDTDFFRMMRIVRDGGYSGFVGIESAPGKAEEEAMAIRVTRDQLKRIQKEQSQVKSIFNGKNLDGWISIEGGEWIIENGVLTGRNGKNWTTNPEKPGSWLSTARQYGDFRLELQYTVNKNGNSGIFFRSAHEKNPAFTGYEIQIYDAPGRPPSKTGPGSIYDTIAPIKNLVRPAGQWNTLTIIAKGPKIQVETNGEKTLEAELNRSMRGYIGLQNHDDKSEVKFRNIRIQEI